MGSIKGTQVNIQLAVSDDISKAISAMNAENAKLNASIQEVTNAKKNASTAIVSAEKSRTLAEDTAAAARKAASDLGVPVESVKGYNEMQKMRVNVANTMDKLKKA